MYLSPVVTVLCLAFLSVGISASEDKRLTVAGTQISGLLEVDETGPYYEIFQELIKESPWSIDLNVQPMRRATRDFVLGEVDCIFSGADTPGFYEQLGFKGELILSSGVYKISTKIYGPKGAPPIDSLEEIKGKTIAVDTGIGSVAFTAHRIQHDIDKVLTASSLADGFQMLDSGRIVGFVAIDSDVHFLISQDARYAGYSVSQSLTVNVGHDLVVCRKSPKTIQFIEYVDMRIKTLRDDGTIDSIMRPVAETSGN